MSVLRKKSLASAQEAAEAPQLTQVALLAAFASLVLSSPMWLKVLFGHGSTIVAPLAKDPMLQTWQIATTSRNLSLWPPSTVPGNVLFPFNETSGAMHDPLAGYAVFARLFDSQLATYNFGFFLSFVLAAVGGALLARVLGVSKAGSVIAGAAFAFNPFRLAHFEHLNILSTGMIPLTLAFWIYAIRSKQDRYVYAGWLSFAWLALTTYFQTTLFVYFLAASALALVIGWPGRLRRLLPNKHLLHHVAGMLLMGFLVHRYALDFADARKLMPDASRSLNDIGLFSPSPLAFLSSPPWGLVWGPIAPLFGNRMEGTPQEISLFPGLVIALLAFYGFRSLKVRPKLKRFIIVGLVAILLLSIGTWLFGGYLTIVPARFILPFSDGIRTPTRAFLYATLIFAVLAGFGFDYLRKWGDARMRSVDKPGRFERFVLLPIGSRGLPAVVVTLTVLMALEAMPGPRSFVQASAFPDQPLHKLAQPMVVYPSLLKRGDELQAKYMYWSSDKFPVIANGYTTLMDKPLRKFRLAVNSFPNPNAVRELKRSGIKTVVIDKTGPEGAKKARVLRNTKSIKVNESRDLLWVVL